MSRVLMICLACLVVVATGCGGDDDEQESASEEWVSGFCSAAADWRTSLEDTVSQFQSPSDLSADSLRSAVDEGLDATDSFVEQVRALGRPETEAGQEAASIVDSMTSEIESTADDLRETFASDGGSLQDLIPKLTQAGTQVTQMGQDLQSSLDELAGLEGGQELSDEINANEDCDAARAGS